MQIGLVVGHAVSTVKHATLSGWRLLVVQLLTGDDAQVSPNLALLVADHPGAEIRILDDTPLANLSLLADPRTPETVADFDAAYPEAARWLPAGDA